MKVYIIEYCGFSFLEGENNWSVIGQPYFEIEDAIGVAERMGYETYQIGNGTADKKLRVKINGDNSVVRVLKDKHDRYIIIYEKRIL